MDKPFVEKLAGDLKKQGLEVWYDKWEIKVGESILWKIEEGLWESDYLIIVISKEAWESEWVRLEITSAWQKQIEKKGKFVLPVYYRACEIPLFLRGIKYADFRKDYAEGLKELLQVFGIQDLETVTEKNWRHFASLRRSGWQGVPGTGIQADRHSRIPPGQREKLELVDRKQFL